LLQVGPDSVFEVNEAFWNVEISLQVKWLCEEEPFAGSYSREDNVNPISTSVVPLTDNKCILGHTLQLMSGCCHVGVDGDLGDCGVSNFEVVLVVSPLTMLKMMVAGNKSNELFRSTWRTGTTQMQLARRK